METSSNIGKLLLEEKLINSEQLASACEFQKKNDVPIVTALISLGFLSEEEMAQALSRICGYPYIDLDKFEVFPDVVDLISADIAKKYLVMPVNRNKSYLSLAMVDPTDLEAINNIKFRTGLNLHPACQSGRDPDSSSQNLEDQGISRLHQHDPASDTDAHRHQLLDIGLTGLHLGDSGTMSDLDLIERHSISQVVGAAVSLDRGGFQVVHRHRHHHSVRLTPAAIQSTIGPVPAPCWRTGW